MRERSLHAWSMSLLYQFHEISTNFTTSDISNICIARQNPNPNPQHQQDDLLSFFGFAEISSGGPPKRSVHLPPGGFFLQNFD